MIGGTKEKITNYFYKGHERTALTKKNVAASFVIKAITILCSVELIKNKASFIWNK